MPPGICDNRSVRRMASLDGASLVAMCRLRISMVQYSEYMRLWEEHFLPVDRECRPVMRLWHQTRSHFNATFLYRYGDIDPWREFEERYYHTWAEVHHLSDQQAARDQVFELETEMQPWIEDDEWLLMREFNDLAWTLPGPDGAAIT